MAHATGPQYLAASLALGLISFWGSENFFWSAPQTGVTVGEIVLTWAAYALCSACALSAVLLTGIAGWKALFLGGALLGWLVEGVVVGTAYEAFPFQLVWTPLAWHALITSLILLGLCRSAVHWPLSRQLAALILLGLGGAYWAQFWPSERGTMPGFAPTFGYLAGLGMAVPIGNLILDRTGPLDPRPLWLLLVAPIVLLLLGAASAIANPDPARLSVPVLIVLTCWAMRRLAADRSALSFAAPAPLFRHAVFLLVPIVTTILAVPGWRLLEGHPANIPVALTSGVVSLGLWIWLVWQALRRPTTPARP